MKHKHNSEANTFLKNNDFKHSKMVMMNVVRKLQSISIFRCAGSVVHKFCEIIFCFNLNSGVYVSASSLVRSIQQYIWHHVVRLVCFACIETDANLCVTFCATFFSVQHSFLKPTFESVAFFVSQHYIFGC